jgi:hypothetical protein
MVCPRDKLLASDVAANGRRAVNIQMQLLFFGEKDAWLDSFTASHHHKTMNAVVWHHQKQNLTCKATTTITCPTAVSFQN